MDNENQRAVNAANQRMQAVDSQIKETMIKELKEKEEFFAKSIIKGTSDLKNRIPEDVFVHHFLKFFTGEETVKDNPEVISKWIGVAGTPMSEVEVMDVSGETIFTVPPLFDTSVINVTERSRSRSLGEITGQYNLMQNNIQKVADDFVGEALDNKANEILKPSDNYSDNVAKWVNIFERYGKVFPGHEPVVKKTINVDVINEVEYD